MQAPNRWYRLSSLCVGLCLVGSIFTGSTRLVDDRGSDDSGSDDSGPEYSGPEYSGKEDGASEDGGSSNNVMPVYDSNGRLLLPADFRQWIFAGSSLGLSYSTIGSGMKMFHHTLMEPTSYRHFSRTGEFREGTQFVLLLHGQGHGVPPQRGGSFAAELRAVEMAVKDSRQFEDGWAYFDFGGERSPREHAVALASKSCYQCHAEHAAYDNVFVQFYPLLRQAAPAGSSVHRSTEMDVGTD